MEEIFAAIDLTKAAAAIAGIMLVGIGIQMAFKGGSLGKRAVNKA